MAEINERPTPYQRLLRRLRENDPTLQEFDYERARRDGGEEVLPWTNEEARDMIGALMNNTTVTTVWLKIDHIPKEQTWIVVKYIQSHPTISKLSVDISDEDNYDREQKYFVDQIFRGVMDNPAVKKFRMFVAGTPNSLFELLTNTKSLTSIDLQADFGQRVATSQREVEEYGNAIFAGLTRNTSLKQMSVVHSHRDEIMMTSILSGLVRHPRLETLRLKGRLCSQDFASSATDVLKLLESTPNLEGLELHNVSPCPRECALLGDLILARTKHSHLKRLHLYGFDLSRRNIAPAPAGSVIASLESIELQDCRLSDSLHPLQLMAGLEELIINHPMLVASNTAWSDLIRTKPNLQKLTLILPPQLGNKDLFSITAALRRHKSLKHLVVSGDFERGDAGEAIRLLLTHNASIEKLELKLCSFGSSGATLIADGICSNLSLKELSLEVCTLGNSGLIALLSAVQESKTLRRLVLDVISMEDEMIGVALEAMLRNNKSLTSLSMQWCSLFLNVVRIAEGLGHNNTLKELDLAVNDTTPECLDSLGRALRRNSSLEDIHLGPVSAEGMSAFFRSLPAMRGLKRIYLEGDASPQVIALILHALRTTNKTLESISGMNYPEGYVKERGEIIFYLKLNRFGRRLLRNPEVPSGLWPHILERMTNPSDEDALFYFLRDAPKQLIGSDSSGDRKRKAEECTLEGEANSSECWE